MCGRKHTNVVLYVEIGVLITDSVPRIEVRFDSGIHLVLYVLTLILVLEIALSLKSGTEQGCLSFGHVAEIADFAIVNIGSLPHFCHAVR